MIGKSEAPLIEDETPVCMTHLFSLRKLRRRVLIVAAGGAFAPPSATLACCCCCCCVDGACSVRHCGMKPDWARGATYSGVTPRTMYFH